MTTIGVAIQKGGTGKTTTAVNLAAGLARSGKRVLLIDLDPQATASLLLGAHMATQSINQALLGLCTLNDVIVPTPIPGLSLAPGHLALSKLESALQNRVGRELLLRQMLAEVASEWDYVVVDTPPALGLLPILALVAADMVIVPLACQEFAVQGLAQVNRTIQEVQKRSNQALKQMILLTLADRRSSDAEAIESNTRSRYGDTVFQTVIPANILTSRGLSHRKQGGAVVAYAPKSPGALAYSALVNEMAKETALCG
jgi:chromosome partitioning protein